MTNPCRLYLISPQQIELPAFVEQAKAAFDAGDVASFQLRLKDTSDEDVLKAAEALLPLCHEHEIAFIMNDRADLAKQCGADGVHVGQDDMSPQDVRAIIGEDAVIGVSCHDSKHMAMEAGDAGADYVAFGAFHATKSKSPEALAKYGTPGPDILEWWSQDTVLPCVAIGGITPSNCTPLVRAGADFIAAITAIWEHEHGPAAGVKEFNTAIERALDES